jgi:TonB family protein
MRHVRSTVVLLPWLLLASSVCQAKHENWVEVHSPNFIVVSNAGEKQARKAALQFEEIRAVFRQSLPVARNHPSPVITVLAVRDEGSMRELLPEYWSKSHSHPAGMFAAQLNQFYAAVQLDAPGTNPYETFYHEYYHTISLPYVPDLPLWLAEGLAEFFGHTNIEEKVVGMGEADPVLLQELRNGSLIPLNVLFQVDRSSPYYNEANKTSIFYAESWALAHYLMIGDRMAHKSMLTAYLSALEQGNSPNEAGTIAFGDLKKLESDLQNYIHGAAYYHLTLPTPKFNDDELKFRLLSDAEAGAYRGGFSVVRGRYQDATATLEEALRLDPKVALAYQYLALTQFFEGQRDKALESASKSIALDPRNAFTRYMRAFLQTGGSVMGSGDPQTEDDLRQAIAINPDFTPPYGLLAVYFAATGRNLDEALALAHKAISFEPGNSNYQLALAQVLVRRNKLDEAELAAKRALAWARQPSEKANAENFKSFLDRFRQLQSEMAANGSGQPQIFAPQNAQGAPMGAGTTAFSATILRVQSNITLIGNPVGTDFKPYLKDLMEAIRKNLMSSVGKLRVGQPKDVTLQLAISKDGSITEMNVASSSGDKALDQATRDGIAASSPLPPLPTAFKGQSLKMRLRFSYTEEQN